jgi:hypothetical protein
VEDSGLQQQLEMADEFLKPAYAVQRTYDMITGSQKTCMPMQYHNHYRRFLIVTSGNLHVKMTPWKSRKYLHPVTDYENYEFRSAMNVWRPDTNASDKMRADYERIQFIEFDVHAGYVLYLPPYWWYSLQFSEMAPNTMVLSASYDSAISVLANSGDLARHFLQIQNNKEIVTRTLVAEPKPVAIKKEETEDNVELPKEVRKELETPIYASGEPHTATALQLAEQLKSPNAVPIREQHEQVMQHILG